MTTFGHRYNWIFSEIKITRKGLTPANGVNPNFISSQKFLSGDSNNLFSSCQDSGIAVYIILVDINLTRLSTKIERSVELHC